MRGYGSCAKAMLLVPILSLFSFGRVEGEIHSHELQGSQHLHSHTLSHRATTDDTTYPASRQRRKLRDKSKRQKSCSYLPDDIKQLLSTGKTRKKYKHMCGKSNCCREKIWERYAATTQAEFREFRETHWTRFFGVKLKAIDTALSEEVENMFTSSQFVRETVIDKSGDVIYPADDLELAAQQPPLDLDFMNDTSQMEAGDYYQGDDQFAYLDQYTDQYGQLNKSFTSLYWADEENSDRKRRSSYMSDSPQQPVAVNLDILMQATKQFILTSGQVLISPDGRTTNDVGMSTTLDQIIRKIIPDCQNYKPPYRELEEDIWAIRALRLQSRYLRGWIKRLAKVYTSSSPACIETLNAMKNCDKCWPYRNYKSIPICWDTCDALLREAVCFDDIHSKGFYTVIVQSLDLMTYHQEYIAKRQRSREFLTVNDFFAQNADCFNSAVTGIEFIPRTPPISISVLDKIVSSATRLNKMWLDGQNEKKLCKDWSGLPTDCYPVHDAQKIRVPTENNRLSSNLTADEASLQLDWRQTNHELLEVSRSLSKLKNNSIRFASAAACDDDDEDNCESGSASGSGDNPAVVDLDEVNPTADIIEEPAVVTSEPVLGSTVEMPPLREVTDDVLTPRTEQTDTTESAMATTSSTEATVSTEAESYNTKNTPATDETEAGGRSDVETEKITPTESEDDSIVEVVPTRKVDVVISDRRVDLAESSGTAAEILLPMLWMNVMILLLDQI